MRDSPMQLVQRAQRPIQHRRGHQSGVANLARQTGADLANALTLVALAPRTISGRYRHGGGSVSLTSAIDMAGMSLMKPRKRRKKKAKLPTVIVVSTRAGRKMPHIYG